MIKTVMERLPKGSTYWFIQTPAALHGLEVISTRDEYFYSDDIRFNNGNYFTSREDCKKMIVKMQEFLYGNGDTTHTGGK